MTATIQKCEDVFDLAPRDRRDAYAQLRNELRAEYSSICAEERRLAAKERHGLATRLHRDESILAAVSGGRWSGPGREQLRHESARASIKERWEAYEERRMAKHLLAVLVGNYDGAESLLKGRTLTVFPDPDGRVTGLVERACRQRCAESPEEVARALSFGKAARARRARFEDVMASLPPIGWGESKYASLQDRIRAWFKLSLHERQSMPGKRIEAPRESKRQSAPGERA